MTYRLWINDLECGIAAEEDATNWLQAIRERYPDADVRIEPALGGTPTFPFGEEEESDAPDPNNLSVTSARCPRLGPVRTFPGFEVMFAFICRECGQAVSMNQPTV